MSIANWIERLVPSGHYTFSKEDIRQQFPSMSAYAIDAAIARAVAKKRILSPHRGFYVAIPEEYRLWKAVPQGMYIDRMMQYLKRPYYVSLLSAAERYGAAHQAPMDFQVMVEPPVLRDKERDGYSIRYSERHTIPMEYVRRAEVPAGWMNVSSPELTAVDLVAYQKHIGGLTRAATVLKELSARLDFSNLDSDFLKIASIPVFQRLGFLLDSVLEEKEKAYDLFRLMKSAALRFNAVPLRLSSLPIDEETQMDKKWNVLVNQEIIIDDV